MEASCTWGARLSRCMCCVPWLDGTMHAYVLLQQRAVPRLWPCRHATLVRRVSCACPSIAWGSAAQACMHACREPPCGAHAPPVNAHTPACPAVGICASRLGAHQPNRRAHPRAVVVEALYAVVIDRAMVCARGLVKVARVVVADQHTVVVHKDLLVPVARREGGGGQAKRRTSSQWHRCCGCAMLGAWGDSPLDMRGGGYITSHRGHAVCAEYERWHASGSCVAYSHCAMPCRKQPRCRMIHACMIAAMFAEDDT